MDRIWLKHYPPGVPADSNPSQYRSINALMDESFAKFRAAKGYSFMGKEFTFGEVDDLSKALGAWLQSKNLPRGARVAIMMPNVVQYPVAIAAILRAGYVVVNVNPLYTPRELEYQLKDSGAEAVIILENFAYVLQQVVSKTSVKQVVVASLGDMLGLKGKIVNFVVRKVKKLVPAWSLPLYHIFALTACFFLALRTGGMCILIPNPRDLPALIAEVSKYKISSFPAVNTLYNGLLHHPDFNKLDFSHLRAANGGGMAVTRAVAEAWFKKTGTPIIEGYGLSETSPTLTCNRADAAEFTGTIGLPVSSTEIVIRDDEGKDVALGEPGEICARGPQVMSGYWNRPDETAKVMTKDGFFRTGDIGVMDPKGQVKIVDRKKDMVLVSGFNVYPSEIEDVVSTHPGVLECAVVGVPDAASGEAVKLFVVKKDPNLTEDAIRRFCAEQLTGYKRPKFIEFRAELPKTPVGKILRRALREEAAKGAQKAA